MNIEICKKCVGGIDRVLVRHDKKSRQIIVGVYNSVADILCFQEMPVEQRKLKFKWRAKIKLNKVITPQEYTRFFSDALSSFECPKCEFYTEQLLDSYQHVDKESVSIMDKITGVWKNFILWASGKRVVNTTGDYENSRVG